jgi:N-acetylmuramoyl-L-alanine amidase
VQNGTILTLIDIQGGWYRVKTSGGVIAYIAAELVEDASGTPAGTVPTASTRQVQVMDGPINVRSGPGTGYEKIGTIEDDAIVTVISESGDWLQIKLNDGRTAYVAAWLVKEVDTDLNTEAIPVVAPGQTQTAAGGTGSAPRVILNGQEMQFETPPIIDNGRTLVPLRAIFEAMGATVDWDDGTRTVTAVKGGTTVVLQVYSTAPTINGKVYSLDVVARIVNNRTLAPLRFVGEAFGGTVNWDANTRTITITGAPDVSAQATVIVNEPGASLRSGPSAGYDKIDSAAAGEKLPVLAEKDGWYQVSRGGRTAWVASWLVQKEDSSTPTQGGNTEPANPAASTQPNGADPGETVVVPVDQSSLNKRGDENAAVEEGYLSLSTCLTAKGYRLVMKSGSKTEPAISRQDNGKRIVFTFKRGKNKYRP